MGHRLHRALTLGAVAIALATGTAATGATAHAAVRSATCGWINIGLPAKYTLNGAYTGEAEQQYDTCNGIVRSHFQWSSGYRNNNPGAYVWTYAESWSGFTDLWATQYASVNQDVFSDGRNIHDDDVDTWHVVVRVGDTNGASCGYALGDWHVYADGGTIGIPQPVNC